VRVRRRFENPSSQRFWEMQVRSGGLLHVTAGPLGSSGTTDVVDLDDAYGPPGVVLNDLLQSLPEGYQEVLLGGLLEEVEAAHGVTLTGRLRDFYANEEYRKYQRKVCPDDACQVDFLSPVVQFEFDEVYYDAKARRPIQLIPIASKWTGADFAVEDEQPWFGVDPALPDGPVLALSTSGGYAVAYPDLDAFLAGLLP
jgi:hypothetical protein